jgi:shikimate dehydrogenase
VGETRLGVLGWPVGHSRSPAMHNAALAEVGLADWRYQHLPVPPALFEATVRALPAVGFVGANVTIPHKEAALALADRASAAARAIGAANTLTFADGAIAADNTDAPGLIAALGQSPAGRSALILGAGGSARAAAWALREEGASDVMVWNRSPRRAEALARDLGVRAVPHPQPADLLVNCTPVGLGAGKPENGTDALKELELDADEVDTYASMVDLVPRPDTPLLRAARARGIRAVDGLEVLVHQGALSFERWTGQTAPLAIMRQAARNEH